LEIGYFGRFSESRRRERPEAANAVTLALRYEVIAFRDEHLRPRKERLRRQEMNT
jgi:hypothetical protein